MTLYLETWHVISLLITIATMLFGAGKAFFSRFEKSMKERDKTLEDVVKRLEAAQDQHGKEIHRLETDMLKMQADLPKTYVHRDDFTREYTTVNAKLDRIWQSLPKRGDR